MHKYLRLTKAAFLPLLLTTACTMSASGQSDDPLECDEDCESGDGGGSGDGNGGGGGDGGGDVAVNADLEIDISGSGIYVGVFPLGCADISGEFSASASAQATLENGAFVIASVDANAAFDLGNGCSCSGIDVNAIASLSISASLAANAASCKLACGGEGDCQSLCLSAGATITANAALDADASVAISAGGDLDLEALVGAKVTLDAEAVLDVHGNVVVNL